MDTAIKIPVAIEDEMKRSYLDYAMSVIIGRALPGHPRRPEAVAPPRAVRHAPDGPRLEPRVPQVREDRRRGDGQLPSPRRQRHLRHPRPHGAGLQPALPAGGRPGQLRVGRRRPAGGHALHRGAAEGARRRDDGRTSTRTRSTSSRTTTRPPTSPPCCRRRSRTCWSTGRRASPSAWPPTSRRTTCGEVIDCVIWAIEHPEATRRPEARRRMWRILPGPDFPTGGMHHRPRRHRAGLPDRPRLDHHPRQDRASRRRRRATGRRSSSPRSRTR